MHVPWKRSGFRWYLIAAGLFANQADLSSVLRGVPFFLAGIAIYFWAKGCLHQDREVTKSGPYRFVRHPFYLGNFVFDLGIVLMSGSELLLLLFPLWWIMVYLPVTRREEKNMEQIFGSAYREYAESVPLMFPSGRHLEPRPGFSWKNPNIYGVELPRALRFLSYPFLFLLVSEAASVSFISSPRPTPMLLVSLSMILIFNGLSLLVKYKYRHKSVCA